MDPCGGCELERQCADQMDLSDVNRRLNREWETGDTEVDGGCGCCGEAGSHGLDPPGHAIPLVARGLAVLVLLLTSVAVALLVMLVQARRGQQSSEMQPGSHSLRTFLVHNSGQNTSIKGQDFRNPSAMLTASTDKITVGGYLEWESKLGNAFCHGGFLYSNGALVVPRKGLYRLFLQITYESKEDNNNVEMKLINKVFSFQDNYALHVVLLSSVDTVSCVESWSKSLYTSGLFSLEANCRLRVNSSHPELIVKNEHQMFFGAELLSQ